jgi:hypothetical protein
MRTSRHFVEWHGELYAIEPLRSVSRVTSLSPLWAVFRRGEFIGTLSYRPDEPLEDLTIRCHSWLQELLDAPRPASSYSRH